MASTKKKTIRKKRTKKRIIKAQPGKSLREVRAAAMQGQEFWPWPLRPYQQAAEDARQRGIKRLGLFWHRRAGKDVYCLSIARNEVRKRIGGYVHFFPKHVQARRAIWQGIDPKKGARFVDIAFGDVEADRNNTEMFIEMYNGSTWQLLGSDNYDRVVGSNAVGVFFSEWALCDPRAWEFIRPIILENDGFAVFITTFRGRNHAWQMAQRLQNNPDWYIDIKTVEDTRDVDGNRIITDEDIQRERESGMSEALLQQEYFCNPEAVAEGAIYGRQVEHLRRDVDRHKVAWNPDKPVYCIWNFDLPVFASCVTAQPGQPSQILDVHTWDFTTLGEAIAKSEQHRWPVQGHILGGHNSDLAAQFWELDRRPEVLALTGHFNLTARTAAYLERCHLDPERCSLLLDSLSGYVRRERFDSQTADVQFSDVPAVSWHQQLAQALETWAAWEYYSPGGQWGKAPDYTVQDRIARTII